MKLAAFSAGRKNGNTEIFIKEALMAAEEMGVEVQLYRLNDFDLSTCTACSPMICPACRDINNCPHKDDAIFLVESFLDCDGVIIGAPVYSLTPNSLLFTFRDRIFGPKMDVATKASRGVEPAFAKGRFKARPGALISVGGALTENWTSLGLASLYSTTFSAQTEVVDHMNIYGVADFAEATIHDEYLARARELGKHVAEAMLSGDHSWRGEEKGVCPQCHLSLLQIEPGTDKVMCPVCGIYGTITVENGKSSIVWPDDEAHRFDNRLTLEGKKHHLDEIMVHCQQYAPREKEAQEKMKKYKAFDEGHAVKSPSREAKRAALREELKAQGKIK